MKILKSFVFFLIIIGCEEPDITEPESGGIIFLTNKSSYTELESVRIVISNKSKTDIKIFLICNDFLEMSYQKKENNIWSDTLWFWYQFARCPSLPVTIKKDRIFNYSMSAKIFASSGEFRLIVDYYNSMEEKVNSLHSNTFRIN